MPQLIERDKRSIRIAAALIAVYLVAFYGSRVWKHLGMARADYLQLAAKAQGLNKEIQPYETKVMLAEKLMNSFRMDPVKLSKTTVVGEASAAIQKAATAGGVQLGPIRESPARASAKELAAIQLEGS